MPLAGLSFTVDQLYRIEECVDWLRWETEAQCVLMADISGHLISVKGKAEMNTAVLSALAAGNLAATMEMARLVGEPARFKLLLHEGEQRSVYLSDVGSESLLIAVVGNETPVGLVRLGAQDAVQRLLEIVEEAVQNAPGSGRELPADLASSLREEMDESWDSLLGE